MFKSVHTGTPLQQRVPLHAAKHHNGPGLGEWHEGLEPADSMAKLMPARPKPGLRMIARDFNVTGAFLPAAGPLLCIIVRPIH
jgi:hypothetical protein